MCIAGVQEVYGIDGSEDGRGGFVADVAWFRSPYRLYFLDEREDIRAHRFNVRVCSINS